MSQQPLKKNGRVDEMDDEGNVTIPEEILNEILEKGVPTF